jgi:hypothetical protein
VHSSDILTGANETTLLNEIRIANGLSVRQRRCHEFAKGSCVATLPAPEERTEKFTNDPKINETPDIASDNFGTDEILPPFGGRQLAQNFVPCTAFVGDKKKDKNGIKGGIRYRLVWWPTIVEVDLATDSLKSLPYPSKLSPVTAVTSPADQLLPLGNNST